MSPQNSLIWATDAMIDIDPVFVQIGGYRASRPQGLMIERLARDATLGGRQVIIWPAG